MAILSCGSETGDAADPAVIEEAREPYVKASIMTPQEFVGNIMPMCQDRRGIFKRPVTWAE